MNETNLNEYQKEVARWCIVLGISTEAPMTPPCEDGSTPLECTALNAVLKRVIPNVDSVCYSIAGEVYSGHPDALTRAVLTAKYGAADAGSYSDLVYFLRLAR